MTNNSPAIPATPRNRLDGLAAAVLAQLPRGNTLNHEQWRRRHRLLQHVLLGHVPFMLGLGLVLGDPLVTIGATLIAPVMFWIGGQFLGNRRLRSFATTGGLVFCSAGLVVLTSGSIEAHFHFFIIIGFIALYQDWVPFLWNVAFTVLSHGIGTIWLGGLIFSHASGQQSPWLWSFIHGVAVLAACVGMVIFWRITEEEQNARERLGQQLVIADAEVGRRRFTSDMLVNLARRNQSMLHRQLAIINQLEEKERDPDALADLFRLDHLATRVRRNAESLLVLAGEQPPRMWSAPVPLRDVVRAAIAETEDLGRVVFAVDDRAAITGRSVADLTHLLAELIENAVRFSPPDTAVTVRARADLRNEGGHLITVEDWGVGMPATDLAEANELFHEPREVDLAVAQRLGFHVVARLAARHDIKVSLGTTPGSGITALVVIPPALFSEQPRPVSARRAEEPAAAPEQGMRTSGWIEPVSVAGPLSAGHGPAAANSVGQPASGQYESAQFATRFGAFPSGATADGEITPAAARPGNGLAPEWEASNGAGGSGSGLTVVGPNALGRNGSGANGSVPAGSGAAGSTAGPRQNGLGQNGSGTNGSGRNGSGTNLDGRNGYSTDDLDETDDDLQGSGLNGSGAHEGSASLGAVDDEADSTVIWSASNPDVCNGPDSGARREDHVRGAVPFGAAAASVDWRGWWEDPESAAPPHGSQPNGVQSNGAQPHRAQFDGAQPNGAQPQRGQFGGAQFGGAQFGGAQTNGIQPRGTRSDGAQFGGQPREARTDGVQPNGSRSHGTESNGVQPNGVPAKGASPHGTSAPNLSAPPVQPAAARPSPAPMPSVPMSSGRLPSGPSVGGGAAPSPVPQTSVPQPRPQGGGRSLRRRVPQSHLAPELRQDTSDPRPATPSQRPESETHLRNAASALSRYQASRQAAKDAITPDNDGGQR